ncbi:TrmH family RNA methyltransferase [Fulvivirgaceae bacterium BMA10]|uniref:TrmH family RNA methyltransferase n=1 Tax=Splendidivirga corallicola TaxID=3051826 RepID=A0ABT8KVB6_9BACT|nr:TrmH family RNA methyltransferase [Fulvivirgaceae bacterium BMA10]
MSSPPPIKIIFILVEPAVPENVGFSARALKTMGFDALRLVNASLHNTKGARNTGYASHDVLDNVQVFKDLPSALDGIDLVVGTSAKQRVTRYDYLHPKNLKKVLDKKGQSLSVVGIVFGSEENGLSKKDLSHCDLISSIPLSVPYPSLNLAQSVLLYAYELSEFSNIQETITDPASSGTQQALKTSAIEMLQWLGFSRHPILFKRILDRLMLIGKDDMQLCLSFLKYLNRKRHKEFKE